MKTEYKGLYEKFGFQFVEEVQTFRNDSPIERLYKLDIKQCIKESFYMNELERKKIVEKIKKDLEAKKNLCLKKEQLEEMIKNPVVHEYLELNKEIEKTEKYKA